MRPLGYRARQNARGLFGIKWVHHILVFILMGDISHDDFSIVHVSMWLDEHGSICITNGDSEA